MSLYGEFDDRFRPRPAPWRLALVALSHVLLASLLANGVVSGVAMYALRAEVGIEEAWIVYATPWDSLRTRMPVPPPAIVIPIACGIVVFAVLLIMLWPSRQSLAARLFINTGGQWTAVASVVGIFSKWTSLSMLIGFAALLVCVWAESSTNELLSGVLLLDRPARRVLWWCVRVLPGVAAIGALSYFTGNRDGWIAAAAIAAVTLLTNLGKRPSPKHELILEPEMREAAAAMPVITILLLAALVWSFGLRGSPQKPRALVITERETKLMTFEEIESESPKWHPAPPPETTTQPRRLDIRWGKRKR